MVKAGVNNGKEFPKENSYPKEIKRLRSSAFKKNGPEAET